MAILKISQQKCRFVIANLTLLIWFTLLLFMNTLVSVVFVLSECIYFAKVCTLVYWLRGMPQPHHRCHPQNVAMPQSKPCLLWTVVAWSEDQESCVVTQHIGKSTTEGSLWLLKQDLLSTVKNNYGSNLKLINKSTVLSWFIFLHVEYIKMQCHSPWSHSKSLATEVNWSKIKFTLLTFFHLT